MQGETHQEQKTEEKIETIAGAAKEMLYKLRNSESMKKWGYENENILTWKAKKHQRKCSLSM